MNVELVRKNKAFHFEATDSSNQKVQIDAGPKVGGEDKGTKWVVKIKVQDRWISCLWHLEVVVVLILA